MRGHEPIIKMRLRGKKPAVVFLNDCPCTTSRDWHNPGEKYGEVWPADHASVCTHGDPLSSLDLRFLVGVRVHVASVSEGRAKALFEKVKGVGAAMVVASSQGSGDILFFEQEKVNG